MKNWRYILIFILLAGNLFVWTVVARASDRTLRVSFLDVGQGDAILIEAPGGNQVLIDGGPGRKILSELGGALPFYDRSLDLVVATHPDNDHIGGLPLVLANYDVAGFLESGTASETAIAAALAAAIKAESAPTLLAKQGMRIELGGGAELEILSALPAEALAKAGESNPASLVAKLTYGATSFLFTGDAPQVVERKLLFEDGKNLDVDVLKVGHHGSKTSSAPDFIAATSPQYSIISVGADNRYGHPDAETLSRLQSASTTILRTDQSGRILIKSDGETVSTANY